MSSEPTIWLKVVCQAGQICQIEAPLIPSISLVVICALLFWAFRALFSEYVKMWVIYRIPPWRAREYTSDLKVKLRALKSKEAEFNNNQETIEAALIRAEEIEEAFIRNRLESETHKKAILSLKCQIEELENGK